MQHAHLPDPATEYRDQHEFDEQVNSKGKLVLEWAAGIAIFAALMMSVVALVKSSQKVEVPASASTPVLKQSPAAAAALAAPTAPAETVSLKVIPEGKKGPEGEKHDEFTVTNFTVKVGQPLKLVIDNTDTTAHSITSPVADINIAVTPGTHTYTLVVTKAGKFPWACVIPCDTWAMQHAGYMAGYITATAS